MMSLGRDPCGDYTDMQSILSVYTKLLMLGENINCKNELRSKTVAGYLSEVNRLHELRHRPKPINLRNSTLKPSILYNNLRNEENIAGKREPITNQTASRIISEGRRSPFTSKKALFRDTTVLAREVGPRSAELVQRTAGKPDYHEYPSGKRVIKALCEDNFTFYDGNDQLIADPVANRAAVRSMVIEWFIQKNRRNGEKLRYKVNLEVPEICAVNAAINLIDRARQLGQPSNLPFAIYKTRSKTKYMTNQLLTRMIREATKKSHTHMSKEELSKYSCHSYRVWACVLLHEAGKDGDYIRVRLRWLSEAYRVYLRDTSSTAKAHVQALKRNTHRLNLALAASQIMPLHETVDEDLEMGEYADHV
jgi:hypothetical protein